MVDWKSVLKIVAAFFAVLATIASIIFIIAFLVNTFDPRYKQMQVIREEIERTEFDNANSVCNLYQQFKELVKQDPKSWEDTDFTIFKEMCRNAGRPGDQ